MALAFGLLPFAGLRASSEPTSLRRGLELLRRDPLLLLLTLIILLYLGAEIGVSNWIAEYFVQVRGATPAQGAYMVSLLWVGLLVGRLVAAAAYRHQRQAPLLVGASALATGALAAALLEGANGEPYAVDIGPGEVAWVRFGAYGPYLELDGGHRRTASVPTEIPPTNVTPDIARKLLHPVSYTHLTLPTKA